MSTRLTFARCRQLRWFSTKPRMEILDSVNDQILNNELKHREHPGIIKPRTVEQPPWLYKTIQIILQDKGISSVAIGESGQKLIAHLHGRRMPPERRDMQLKLKEVCSRIQQDISEDELLHNRKALRLFKTLVYNWIPVNYDAYTSLSYLISRSVPEYSVLYKLFNEIKTRDDNFIPKTLFDFGSGVGTVIWAASQFWTKSIKEYYCVDASPDMNDLSEYLLKRSNTRINISDVFYKQFLPVSANRTYDIVVSAYSLLELPNQISRLEVIGRLWRITERYLVIVEQGTKCGFDIINEAREFILMYNKIKGHVFSPCPHDLSCPRHTTDDTPCNFELSYLTLPIPQKSQYKSERYSYVILKKGERPEDDCKWPRIVREVLKRSRHAICRTCTASGELQEHIFTTAKHGKNTYRCARSSRWGDRLPFVPKKTDDIVEEKITAEITENERTDEIREEETTDEITKEPK